MDHRHSAGCQCTNEDVGEKFSLYKFVNVPGLQALNAKNPEALKLVLRPENEKLEREDVYVESDDDDQLILVLPFVGSVRLRKIIIMAAGDTCPTEVRLFKNVEVGFDNVDSLAPTQTLPLGDDPEGELERSVMAPKWNDCRTLTMFFPGSDGGDVSRIYYIGLLGDHIKPQGQLKGVVYESKPQLKDHETRADQAGKSNMGM